MHGSQRRTGGKKKRRADTPPEFGKLEGKDAKMQGAESPLTHNRGGVDPFRSEKYEMGYEKKQKKRDRKHRVVSSQLGK